jgi:hypothetical protein
VGVLGDCQKFAGSDSFSERVDFSCALRKKNQLFQKNYPDYWYWHCRSNPNTDTLRVPLLGKRVVSPLGVRV